MQQSLAQTDSVMNTFHILRSLGHLDVHAHVTLAEHQCRTGAATEASRFAKLAKTGLRYSLQALKAFKLCLGCVLEAGHDVSVQLRQEDTDAWTDISFSNDVLERAIDSSFTIHCSDNSAKGCIKIARKKFSGGPYEPSEQAMDISKPS